MTARERWKALHRARRRFRRDNERQAREILEMPQARSVDRYRAAMRLVNPPIVIDTELNRIAGRIV